MHFFLSLFLMCHAAEEDALLLLQTRAGEVSDTNTSDESGLEFDRALAAKGTPQAPPPTPAPTPPLCNGVKLNQFNGETFAVSQTSTYYGKNTYTYHIQLGGNIRQITSDAGSYNLGSHSSYGNMEEYFRDGTKCGNTPRRADVFFTPGHDLRLLSAEEPEKCVYKFRIQLPQSYCNLPVTTLDDLDTNNDEGVNEHEQEIQAEENKVHNCETWCDNRKKRLIPWKEHQVWEFEDGTKKAGPHKPFRCAWFQCADCAECGPF